MRRGTLRGALQPGAKGCSEDAAGRNVFRSIEGWQRWRLEKKGEHNMQAYDVYLYLCEVVCV